MLTFGFQVKDLELQTSPIETYICKCPTEDFIFLLSSLLLVVERN